MSLSWSAKGTPVQTGIDQSATDGWHIIGLHLARPRDRFS